MSNIHLRILHLGSSVVGEACWDR